MPNSPPPSGIRWTKCGKIFDAGRTTSHVLNSGVTEPNLTKIAHKVENWWPINTLKSEFQYSNSFSNASMTNGRRSSNWSLVAAQFPFVSLFSAETTGPIFTNILHDIVALVALLNHTYTRRMCIPFLMEITLLCILVKLVVLFFVFLFLYTFIYTQKGTHIWLMFRPLDIFAGSCENCQVQSVIYWSEQLDSLRSWSDVFTFRR